MKIRKTLALITAFIMVLSTVAATAVTASASNPLSNWFEFDKKTGGWIVKNIAHAAEDPPQRVQIITFGETPNDNDYEVLLTLPEGVEFKDIASARLEIDADWDKYPEDERMDVIMVTQTNIKTWNESRFTIESLMENPIVNAPIEMFTIRGTTTIYAEYLKVIVTNYAYHDFPRPPVTVKVNLFDTNGKRITLICPDCKGSPCKCPCTVCKKYPCECICDECEKENKDCVCCDLCNKKDCICPPPPTITTPAPPEETTAPEDKIYNVLEAFAEWNGSGNAVVRIDADHTKFTGLTCDGYVIDPANYTITAGSTIITLHEAYLKSLPNGTYNFVATFADGFVANIPLAVNSASAPAPVITTTAATTGGASGAPKGGVAIVIIPTLLAAGAVAVSAKKRKY